MLEEFLIVSGLYAISWYLYENFKSGFYLLKALWGRFLNGDKKLNLVETFGSWAVITGATDGIGKAYARELAKRGLNVVLISRTKSKLEELASLIQQESSVKTHIIVADFTKGPELYEHIEKELGSLPIGILVNNVGTSTDEVGILAAQPVEQLWNVIHTNIIAVTIMSRLMARRFHRTGVKGCIVNISSITEHLQFRYGAIYVASKWFTRSLTITLQDELKPYGIRVQLVSPGFVVTKINSFAQTIMKGGLFIPSADTYARYAVDTIGITDATSGYIWHSVSCALMKLLPFDLRILIINFFSKLLLSEKPLLL